MSDYPFFPGTYRARCVRVIDGDTADFEVDAGFHMRYVGRFRLLGVDTPELNATDPVKRSLALSAYETLKTLLFPGFAVWQVKLANVKRDPDSFGRYLACPFVIKEGNEIDVCAFLVDHGLATPYARK